MPVGSYVMSTFLIVKTEHKTGLMSLADSSLIRGANRLLQHQKKLETTLNVSTKYRWRMGEQAKRSSQRFRGLIGSTAWRSDLRCWLEKSLQQENQNEISPQE